jgi:hypothetical protein
MAENHTQQRPVVPEASKRITLRRDRRLERQIRTLSAQVQQELEEGASQSPIPTFRFLRTVVR